MEEWLIQVQIHLGYYYSFFKKSVTVYILGLGMFDCKGSIFLPPDLSILINDYKEKRYLFPTHGIHTFLIPAKPCQNTQSLVPWDGADDPVNFRLFCKA